jgi:UDP-N-acetylenolpyruvoylglucosamine reductase
VKFKELALAAKAAGIGGFEWMEGIPGCVGGGLRMNAGAMGGETFRQVCSLRVVDSEGEVYTRVPTELEVRYRGVPSLARQYATSAIFEGQASTPEEINRLLNDFMHKRWAVQPKEPSSGCTFKNPEACPAGKLVEELGLKDAQIGGARVSGLHGNFIINQGGATAADMLALIHQIKAAARTQRGIDLETEVQIVGEDTSFI